MIFNMDEHVVLIIFAVIGLIVGCLSLTIFVNTFIPRIREEVIARVQKLYVEKSHKEVVLMYDTLRWGFFVLGLASITLFVALVIKLNIG